MLTTFKTPATIAVVGAAGGIGSALVECLSSHPLVSCVHALARSPITAAPPGVITHTIDITQEQSVAVAAAAVARDGPVDLIIVATGLLHDDTIRPERRLRDVDPAAMAHALNINTIGPTLVAKHFLPLLNKDTKSVFAVLSARVGSISDNRLGGWVSYRASKSALNMVIKTLAIEHARTRPHSLLVSLHPGTVATGLSAPFQKRVPASQLFSPEQSAEALLQVIDNLTPADTGGFFAWDGSPIEF